MDRRRLFIEQLIPKEEKEQTKGFPKERSKKKYPNEQAKRGGIRFSMGGEVGIKRERVSEVCRLRRCSHK